MQRHSQTWACVNCQLAAWTARSPQIYRCVMRAKFCNKTLHDFISFFHIINTKIMASSNSLFPSHIHFFCNIWRRLVCWTLVAQTAVVYEMFQSLHQHVWRLHHLNHSGGDALKSKPLKCALGHAMTSSFWCCVHVDFVVLIQAFEREFYTQDSSKYGFLKYFSYVRGPHKRNHIISLTGLPGPHSKLYLCPHLKKFDNLLTSGVHRIYWNQTTSHSRWVDKRGSTISLSTWVWFVI